MNINQKVNQEREYVFKLVSPPGYRGSFGIKGARLEEYYNVLESKLNINRQDFHQKLMEGVAPRIKLEDLRDCHAIKVRAESYKEAQNYIDDVKRHFKNIAERLAPENKKEKAKKYATLNTEHIAPLDDKNLFKIVYNSFKG